MAVRKGVDVVMAVWKVVKGGFSEEEILDGAEAGKRGRGWLGTATCRIWCDRDRLRTV